MADNYSNNKQFENITNSSSKEINSNSTKINNYSSYNNNLYKTNNFNSRLNNVSNKANSNRDKSLYDNTNNEKFANSRREMPSNKLSPIDKGNNNEFNNYSGGSLPPNNLNNNEIVNKSNEGLNNNNINNNNNGNLAVSNDKPGIYNDKPAVSNNKSNVNNSNPNNIVNKTLPKNGNVNNVNSAGKNSSNSPQNKLKQKNAEKALTAINPVLGAIAKTKKGKQITQALSNSKGKGIGIGGLDKFKGMLPTNSNGEQVDQDGKNIDEKKDEKRVAEGHATFTKKQKRWFLAGGITSAVTVMFTVCILFVAVQALKTILGDDLTRVIITNPDVTEKLFGGEDQLGNDDVNNNITELGSERRSTSSSSGSTVTHRSSSSSSSVLSSTGSATIDKLNEIALGEVGNGPEKYWNWYGMSSDWCAMFVLWLFDKIDGIDKYVKRVSVYACDIPRESDKAGLGTWYEDECTDSSTVPKAGDVVVFDPYVNGSYTPWPANGGIDKYWSSHVGYVYDVDDNNIYTVEGNSNNQVEKKSISRKKCGGGNGQGINGYFRPNY